MIFRLQICCFCKALLAYLIHLSDPSFHSWINPNIKIIKNIALAVIEYFTKFTFILKINGNNKATSISKIKKITASRKNRIENGSRAESFGSKPHSNGVFLFRDWNVFFPTTWITASNNKPKSKAQIIWIKTINIITGIMSFLTFSGSHLEIGY